MADDTLLSGAEVGAEEEFEAPASRGKGRKKAASGELDKKELLNALMAFKRGDFGVRLNTRAKGIDGRIAEMFNSVVETNQKMSKELWRMSKVVGKEGKIDERASLGQVRGAWGSMVESINNLIADVVWPTSETARVIGAVANGDLSQAMATQINGRPLRGEFKKTATTVNTMVQQLGSFAAEVTRVARDVGTVGKLGGQA